MDEEAREGYAVYHDVGRMLGYKMASELLRDVLKSENCFWKAQESLEEQINNPSSKELATLTKKLKTGNTGKEESRHLRQGYLEAMKNILGPA